MGLKHSKIKSPSHEMRRRHSFNDKDLPSFQKTQVSMRRSIEPKVESSFEEDFPSEFPTSSQHDHIQINDSKEIHSMPRDLPIKSFTRLPARIVRDQSLQSLDSPRTSPIVERFKLPSILYYVDQQRIQLCVYDTKTQVWKKNDLRLAHCEHSDFELSSYGAAVIRNEIISHLQESTLVAVDNDTIHFIGKIHLEYCISRNSFKFLGEHVPKFTNPTVCCSSDNIFFLSGEQDGEFVSSCARYDLKKKVWIPMPNAPYPHVNGSALCYIDSEKNYGCKILVVGGLESRIPTLFNYNISIFDLESETWEVIPIADFCEKPPRLIRAPIVQNDRGKILVIHDENGIVFYEFDPTDGTFAREAGLCPLETFNIQRRVSYCLDEDDQLVFLSKISRCTNSFHLLGEESPRRTTKKKSFSEYSIVKVSLTPKQSLIFE